MTGAPPVQDRPALWAALSHMQIPVPGTAARFEDALAGRQGWTIGFAERVTHEYRRFLYLAATAGFEVTPSRTVDEAWHLHLECPHYREILCGRILGRPLDHRPSEGEPGEAERHHRQYEATVALYERAFLKPPPSDIWPGPATWEKRQVAAKRRRERKAASAIAAGAAISATASYLLGYPVAAIVLLGVAVIFALFSLHFFSREARSRNAGGGGGSGCGGCGGWSQSDGGESGIPDGDGAAGCGGGCGGD